MRTSYLKPILEKAGAVFEERCGTEVVSHFSDIATENSTVRNVVGLTDFSFLQMYRMPEETAIEFLDGVLAGNVASTRFGRITHTFLADDDGNILSDCYVANNDEEFLLLCESVIDTDEVDRILDACGAQDAGVERLHDSHVLLGLDGFDAWKVVRDAFGSDVLGLPYLSVEIYPFEGEDILLMRAGKTSEFGYLVMAPTRVAAELYTKLQEAVKVLGGGPCGVAVHDGLRLEGRFFNIFKEGVAVRDPLVLGLQWMIDFDKESFHGGAAIATRRAEGVKQKIVGVAAAADCESLVPGAMIYHAGQPVAEVVASCHSYVLDQKLALAVFPFELAYSGVPFTLGAAEGPSVRTISMPPILPKSLTLRLDEV